MIDPIEQTLSDLTYLGARLAAIERLAVSTDRTRGPVDSSLEAIAEECSLLRARIVEMRKTLDPEYRP